MTKLEQDLMEATTRYQPTALPPLPSAALMAARDGRSTRRTRRLEWAVAGLSGALVALGWVWAVDRRA